jgi:hypothetical protein
MPARRFRMARDICLGVTILGERLNPEHVLGMALIGAGLAAIDGRLGKRLERRMARSGSRTPT